MNAIRTKGLLFARALRLIWAATRRWSILWAAMLVLQGAMPALVVYLSKILVDRLAVLVGSGTGADITPLVGPLFLLGGVMLLTQVLQGAIGWVRTAQAELLQDHIKARVHDQAARVDLEFL